MTINVSALNYQVKRLSKDMCTLLFEVKTSFSLRRTCNKYEILFVGLSFLVITV